jgi:hypothetical protein
MFMKLSNTWMAEIANRRHEHELQVAEAHLAHPLRPVVVAF